MVGWRWWRERTRVLVLAAVFLAPLLALNLSVAFFGNSFVFPLSPFYLSDKATALRLYARHRVVCLFRGHPDPAPLIAAAERKQRLPKHLLAAVIEVESEGRAHRISFAGAMGIAQIVPATAQRLHLEDPFDTAGAIDASARYLAAQLDRTRSARLAVASYNAGPGKVHGAVPHNGETEVYVERVMGAWRKRR